MQQTSVSQPNIPQKQKRKRFSRKIIICIILLASTIIIALSILSAINIIPTIWSTSLSITVGVLGVAFALIPLVPTDDTPEQTLTPATAQNTIVPTPAPHTTTIINIDPLLFSQPTPQKPSPTANTDYVGIRATPPPTDPKVIQQREHVVKEVYAKLAQPDITAVALTDIGGIGKSTLAALIYKYAEAQRIAGKGVFHAESLWLRVDANTTFLDLAGNIFAALSKPPPNFAHLAPQNQAFALFNLLNTVDTPRLLVLDQFENFLNWDSGCAQLDRSGVGEFIDALNSQSCICRVLLTSRPRPKGTRESPLAGMHMYPVGGLTIAEGTALLRSRGVTATEAELQTAVKRCDGHGLSLELLAILISEQKLSLSDLLKDPQLWDGDIANNLLDYIYTKQLSEVQRKLLQSFSAYREGVPLDAVQVLMKKTTQAQVSSTLRVLLTQYLIQPIGEGRYQLHPIVATYAQHHFVEHDEQANQQAIQVAHTKAAQYYLQQAALSCPPRDKRQRISDVTPFIEAVWQQCQAGQWEEAYDLMNQESLFADLSRWGGNVILLDLCQLLVSEKWQPAPQQTALILNNLGKVYDDLGQKQQALSYYEQALLICREVGDRGGEGTTLNNLGRVYDDLGQKQEALSYYEQALRISKEVGDRGGEGTTLNNLGSMYDDLGQKQQALSYYNQALLICREVGDRAVEGITLNNLGSMYDDLGQKQEALSYYNQALLICREVGDRTGEGTTLNNLGSMYHDLGQKQEALSYYEQALLIRREVGDRAGEGTTLNNLGGVYHALGQKQEALSYYEQALLIRREVGDRAGEGTTLNNLGGVYDDLGQKQEVLSYLDQALRIFREVGDRGGEGTTLHNIGTIYFERRRYDVALACLLLAKGIFEQVQSPHVDDEERWIDDLRSRVGERDFAVLLAQVEPHAQHIVDEALREEA